MKSESMFMRRLAKAAKRMIVGCTGALAAIAAAADAAALQATVNAQTIEVREATSGGEVVLFTASLAQRRGVLLRASNVQRIADDDGDGRITFTTSRPYPLQTICVAVDLVSGRAVIATRDGYEARRVEFPSQVRKKDAEGMLGFDGIERLGAEMVIVRPKSGAWRLRAAEGGAEDGDRRSDGRLSLLNSDAVPVGASGNAPRHLRKGDVVAVIDGGRMEVFVTEIDK